MEQNTYHIPLVLQYFLQGTLEINFSVENKIFMGFQNSSWNLYFFRGNPRNSWEFSIFAEITISAPHLRADGRTQNSAPARPPPPGAAAARPGGGAPLQRRQTPTHKK